jgi:hypothetical protein
VQEQEYLGGIGISFRKGNKEKIAMSDIQVLYAQLGVLPSRLRGEVIH